MTGNVNTSHTAIANRILDISRNSILLDFRFIGRAIGLLSYEPSDMWPDVPGTDGKKIYFSPDNVIATFKASKDAIDRTLLHMIMHCLYQHPFNATGKNRQAWDLACDIFVEDILIMLYGNVEADRNDIARGNCISELKKQMKSFSANSIYNYIIRNGFANTNIFERDSHEAWYTTGKAYGQNQSRDQDQDQDQNQNQSQEQDQSRQSDEKKQQNDNNENGNEDSENNNSGNDNQDTGNGQGGQSQQERNSGNDNQDTGNGHGNRSQQGRSHSMKQTMQDWQNAAKQIEVALKSGMANGGKMQGKDPGNLASTLFDITRERMDYTEFLRRFAQIEERMQIDPDEFDYIYYTYGFEQYGNVPLIEPLEYREAQAIRSFVIAVDTSGSCDDNLIRKFLMKTYDVLCETALFEDKKILVHIIQCDADVTEDKVIQSKDEMAAYAKAIQVRGRRGTDFRPVFRYVRKLREKGKLDRIDGLIYFTDGYGTFPQTPTEYKTAFVLSEASQNVNVPAWAVKTVMEEMENAECA